MSDHLPETPTSVVEYIEPALREYGSYVLMQRAVSDHHDGLKPVQRRLLWEAFRQKMLPNTSFRKSAKLVGGTMGNWHPHGNQSCYMALVGMVHDRYPLFEGHGNFGSATDSPAAERYTEVRLTKFALTLFEDLAAATFIENYSGDAKEPIALPPTVPLALLNGSEGIAVGIRAAIPPHNFKELIETLMVLIRTPSSSLEDLLGHLKGPDYGTGILLSNQKDLLALYRTGKGSLRFRCQYHIEPFEDHWVLVVTEPCPQFNVVRFLKICQSIADEGFLLYATDQSGSKGFRLVIGFNDPLIIKERIINLLYTTVSYSFFASKRQKGSEEINVVLRGLKELLNDFIDFRRNVETIIITKQLEELKEKLHIEKIKLDAIKSLDKLWNEVKKKQKNLSGRIANVLDISEKDAEIICNSSLVSLTKANEKDQVAVCAKLVRKIDQLQKDLETVDKVVLARLKNCLKFADPRGTKIAPIEDVELPEDPVSRYVTAKKEGLVQRWFTSVPTKGKGWSWDFFVDMGTLVTVVQSNGMAKQVPSSILTTYESPFQIVGLVPSHKNLVVVVDEEANFTTIKHPQSISSYGIMNTKCKLIHAVGLNPTDTLVIYNRHLKKLAVVEALTLYAKRRNSKGSRWCHFLEVTDLLCLPEDGRLFDPFGTEILKGSPGEKIDSEVPLVIGTSNFVITHEGKKKILGQKEAIEQIKDIKTLFAF